LNLSKHSNKKLTRSKMILFHCTKKKSCCDSVVFRNKPNVRHTRAHNVLAMVFVERSHDVFSRNYVFFQKIVNRLKRKTWRTS